MLNVWGAVEEPGTERGGALSCASEIDAQLRDDGSTQAAQESCREPLEVHGSGGQGRLDAHILQSTPPRARRPCQVFASPWKPSERQRCRRYRRWSSADHRL